SGHPCCMLQAWNELRASRRCSRPAPSSSLSRSLGPRLRARIMVGAPAVGLVAGGPAPGAGAAGGAGGGGAGGRRGGGGRGGGWWAWGGRRWLAWWRPRLARWTPLERQLARRGLARRRVVCRALLGWAEHRDRRRLLLPLHVRLPVPVLRLQLPLLW